MSRFTPLSGYPQVLAEGDNLALWRGQPSQKLMVNWGGVLGSQATHVIVGPDLYVQSSNGARTSLQPLSSGVIKNNSIGQAFAANGGTSDGFTSVVPFNDASGATSLSVYLLGIFPTASGAVGGRWGETASNGSAFVITFDSSELSTVHYGLPDTYAGRRTTGLVTGKVSYGNTWLPGSANINTPYLNGRKSVGSQWFAGDPAALLPTNSSNYPLHLCRHGVGASGSGDAQINLMVLGVNKAWSDSVHRMFHDNPWQLFAAD